MWPEGGRGRRAPPADHQTPTPLSGPWAVFCGGGTVLPWEERSCSESPARLTARPTVKGAKPPSFSSRSRDRKSSWGESCHPPPPRVFPLAGGQRAGLRLGVRAEEAAWGPCCAQVPGRSRLWASAASGSFADWTGGASEM